MSHRSLRKPVVRIALTAVASLVGLTALTGCLVAGVSSNGGAFLWPGGLGLVVIILLVVFLLRRR
jgi:ABC-type proline/glycine betaine transport system permease subunit